MVAVMAKLGVAVLALMVCSSCHDANAQPTNAPLANKIPVNGYCSFSTDQMFSTSTGRKGRYLKFDLLLALEGDEVVTVASELHKTEHVGDKTHMRVLVAVGCHAFMLDGKSFAQSLADDHERNSCDFVGLLLNDLDKGKGFSVFAQPRQSSDWRLTAVAPDLDSFAVGSGDGEDIRLTGFHPFSGDALTDKMVMFDSTQAHASWDYVTGLGGKTGKSRVSLAADCPAHP